MSMNSASSDMNISVIIPAYNAEKYLAETAASVQAQTYARWELVIVNDGSHDETGLLADNLAAQDPRIRVVHQANAGLAAARNSGLAASSPSAEYVLFLDADDTLEPNALHCLKGLLEVNPTAPAAHGLARYINGEGHVSRPGEAEAFGRSRQSVRLGRLIMHPVKEPTSFCMLAYRNIIMTPGQVLIRRTELNRVGAFDVTISPTADWDMWLRITQKGEMPLTEKVVLSYRRHEHNMSGSGQNMRTAEMMMRVKAFQTPDLTDEQRRAVLDGFRYSERDCAVQWGRWGVEALSHGRPRQAVRNLRIAAKYYRWSLGTPLAGEKFSTV